MKQQTAVYRFFDKDKALLYVGMSHNWWERFQSHYKEKTWISQVSQVQIEWVNTRSLAEMIESAAIRWEKPKYNIKGQIDPSVWDHFYTLADPVSVQDEWHGQLASLIQSHLADETLGTLDTPFRNKFEWAVSNAYSELTTSEDVYELPCKVCSKIANAGWVHDGHAAVCDVYMVTR